jgi:AraC-like DNA-binding protein
VLSLIVGLWQIGNALTGKMLEGAAEVTFPAPEYIAKVPFASGLIKFDRPANRLIFAAKLLDTPLKTADPIATQLARAQCERELAAIVDAGFPGRVRAAIARRAEGVPSLAEVARELHVSTRTLKRKLADRGTTFSAILDDVRRQRALLLLDNRELSIGEIAGKLGYSEVPNFTRAFRKWTGTTPGAYRTR